jgi:hypothetical protein
MVRELLKQGKEFETLTLRSGGRFTHPSGMT